MRGGAYEFRLRTRLRGLRFEVVRISPALLKRPPLKWASDAGIGRPLLRLAIVVLLQATAAGCVQYVGDEFLVSTTAVGRNGAPAVDAAADGSFLVVWNGRDERSDVAGAAHEWAVFGRRYDSTGSALGTEFFVSSAKMAADSSRPAASVASDGCSAVVWTGSREGGMALSGRFYDPTGAVQSSELTDEDADRSSTADVAALASSDYVVVWTSDSEGDQSGIFARRYDSSGTLAGTEFQVNEQTAGRQDVPRIGATRDRGFLVVWAMPSGDLHGQRYDSAAQPRGTEFQINSFTESAPTPAVAGIPDGSFVVTWSATRLGMDDSEVMARQYYPTGGALGSEFQVNVFTPANQWSPSVTAARPEGRPIFVWTSDGEDGDGPGVFGRYGPFGEVFQVNTYTEGAQDRPAVASLARGDFVIVWKDDERDAILGRRFTIGFWCRWLGFC